MFGHRPHPHPGHHRPPADVVFGFGPHRRWSERDAPADWFGAGFPFGPFGPFGRGGPFGRRWGGGGPGGWGPGQGERFFGRGDLKYVILELLRDQPRHGYDIIRALEERMRGAYRPSPGSVYPTLQMLEDLGYVTSSQQEGKKVYSITEEGQRYLDEQQSTLDDIRSRITAGWEAASRPEAAEVMHELRELGRVLFQQATGGGLNNPDRLRHLTAILRRARSEIETSAYQPSASGPSGSPPQPDERMI